jgi:hypothetical protein
MTPLKTRAFLEFPFKKKTDIANRKEFPSKCKSDWEGLRSGHGGGIRRGSPLKALSLSNIKKTLFVTHGGLLK